MELKGNMPFKNGIPVFESWALPNERFIYDKLRNIFVIPENGVIYSLFFQDGVTSNSIKMAVKFALGKLESKIDEMVTKFN